MNYKYVGFIVIPIFLLGAIGITSMIATASYQWLLLTAVFWMLMSGLGIAVGYHRIFSHRCYQLKPWLDMFILFCGTLACQMSSITWTAIHMGYHHPHSDKEQDFHSPTKGFWVAFVGWTFTIKQDTLNYKHAVRLLRKPWHVFFHKNYFLIVWGFAALFLLIFGWQAFVYGYGIAATIAILQDNLTNVLGHAPKLGYRNYELNDISSNFPLLGYFGWGQGWHNNHHKFPGRFNFGVKWWEFDPCVIFIPLMKLGREPRKQS
jgi:stearoyl-CoA desaturase (delta-9 desaturase)